MGVGRPAWPRPVGLGILPFWLNFVYVIPKIKYSPKLVVPGIKYSPKLVELVNVSENHSVMVLKV